MPLRKHLKRDLEKVVVIAVAYLLLSCFIALYKDALLHSELSLGPANAHHFWRDLLANLIVGLMAGLLGGSLLVWVNGELFKKQSFRYAMITTALGYIGIFFLISLVVGVVMIGIDVGFRAGIAALIPMAISHMATPVIITDFALWGGITMLTLFILQMNDQLGPGVLFKFLKGQYHDPREEQRLFMFLDMKSSTTIAEQIGNTQYFRLLSELYVDLAEPIVDSNGEIYQYVGDEIVITWEMKKGVDEANCLICFQRIQEKLDQMAPHYEATYGVRPVFKAGLHHGSVMAGELGSIKRDIVYSGDVLNTAARIQGLCNSFKTLFLVSDDTQNLFRDHPSIRFKQLGLLELRGKQQKKEIFAVEL